MAQSKYLKQNGEVIYPYTTTHEVLNSAGLGCFDWCNGIIWCYATASGTSWTIHKNFGSNGITISSITGNTGDSGSSNIATVTFSSALPNAYYAVFISGEASGVGAEILGVNNRTTTTFKIENRNYSGTAVNLTELSLLIIY